MHTNVDSATDQQQVLLLIQRQRDFNGLGGTYSARESVRVNTLGGTITGAVP
jgi:hypothetical protein